MDQTYVSFPLLPSPQGKKLSKLVSFPNITIHSKVKNNNVTSPSPICPCCMSNEKKKKHNLSNIVKESTVISSTSF